MCPSTPRSRLLVALLVGASACDATVAPLRHPGVDAGLSPTGGARFDTRLSGCVREVRSSDGEWEAISTTAYDALGRRTHGAYFDGLYTIYDENVSWDAGSCPTLVTGEYADDIMWLVELEFTQTCDAMGNVIESSSAWETYSYTHTYDASGGLLSTVETVDGAAEWAYEYHYAWEFGRVSAITSGRSGEDDDFTENRSFGADGWVRSYEDTWGTEGTWTYDALGRAITGWNGETYEYEGLSAFPIRGRDGDTTLEYSVVCGP